MSYTLKSVKLEGIRGFNKATDIEINEGLTIIHGPNGTGKSSILQAIEWCITGAIPYMSGGDFTKEDAIVNAFTATGQARVELVFSGPQEILLSRTKKRTKSTTAGKHQLILDADRSYMDDEAEAYLEDTFKLSLDDVPRSKFLHQETIRDALTYKPAERSAVIEKLLGTYEIKEFTKALDQSRRVNNEIKTIDGTIESLNRDRIQFILNLRRNLDQLKNNLSVKGYREDELSIAWTLTEVEQLRKLLEAIAEKINVGKIIHPDVSPTVQSLVEANNRIIGDITSLDRERMRESQVRQSKIVTLQGLLETYQTALEHFKDFETLDVEALEKDRNELAKKIAALREEIESLQKKLTLLPSRVSVYQNAKLDYTSQKTELENIRQEHGNMDQIDTRIGEIQGELEEIQRELRKFSGQQRVVNLAADLIQETGMGDCPVCSQSINAIALVSELRSQVSSDIATHIMELNRSIETGKSEIAALVQVTENISKLVESVRSLEGKFNSSKIGLEELTGIIGDETELDSIQKGWEEKATQMQEGLTELNTQYSGLDEKIQQRNFLTQELSNTLGRLQKEVEEELEEKWILDAGEELINRLTAENKVLEDTTTLDTTRTRTQRLAEVLDYLRDEERTQNAEKDLPALNDQINNLEARKASLLHLSGALGSIRSIMTEYQKVTSLQQISDLENMMNEYYTAIHGHPYYKRIKIDIEKQDPLQFSFRAASDRESTYIPTRFSTAQLNIVALSIFISNSKLMAGQLPLLTLDSPTQNMDDAHKEAFATLLSRLTEDFQVIIATEDDETKDHIMAHCTDASCYELRDWGTEGPQISSSF